MRVAIGKRVYELKTIAGQLVVNGEACASVVDHDKREILVSDIVPMQLRMHVAAQAVSEAWGHVSGRKPGVPFVGKVD